MKNINTTFTIEGTLLILAEIIIILACIADVMEVIG